MFKLNDFRGTAAAVAGGSTVGVHGGGSSLFDSGGGGGGGGGKFSIDPEEDGTTKNIFGGGGPSGRGVNDVGEESSARQGCSASFLFSLGDEDLSLGEEGAGAGFGVDDGGGVGTNEGSREGLFEVSL